MAEKLNEQEWWLNMGNVSNKASEVTAEELGNVASSLAKWQAIGWQIRDDQRKNTNTSKFLTYLLLNIQNESIWASIDMFVRYIPIPDSEKKQMSVMTDEIVWLFLPLYSDVADQFDLAKQYPIEYHHRSNDIISYTDYISQLMAQYPDMYTLHSEQFVTLIIDIMDLYQIIDRTQMDNNKLLQLKHNLIQKFFLIKGSWTVDIQAPQ